MREIESGIKTITAGNGAIYACRNEAYYDFEPIACHDAAMPLRYGLQGKRAIYNKDAVAYEKAGENNEDEFKRKARMNRGILNGTFPPIQIYNLFKHFWFSFFYLGHRTSRYSLWLYHIIAYISNIVLVLFKPTLIYSILLILQTILWAITFLFLKRKTSNRLLSLVAYYGMTILAQYVGVYNMISGKTKPTWEKAESTR